MPLLVEIFLSTSVLLLACAIGAIGYVLQSIWDEYKALNARLLVIAPSFLAAVRRFERSVQIVEAKENPLGFEDRRDVGSGGGDSEN